MKKQLINLNPVKEQVKQKLLEKYDTTLFMNTSKIELRLDIEDILNEYIESQHIVEPTVCITPHAYIKMRMLVDKHDKEIGWYGIVNQMPGLDAVYVIEDIIVYPQKVTGTTVEQDDDRMFEFEMSLTTEQVNHKRFHGHSHVNMSTGPSGVDENFYQEILTQVNDYFIITVTNKRNEYTTRFYDMANNILYTDVPIQLVDENGTMFLDWYEDEIKKVENKPAISYGLNKSSTGVTTASTYKNFKQKSIWDEEDEDDMFYDPYIYDYITKDEYKDIYGHDYTGQFNKYNNKKGKKKHGNNRSH